MNENDFLELCRKALNWFGTFVPEDTGNMWRNAVKLEARGPFAHDIVIDEKIAPYSVYTVIPWSETSPVIVNSDNPELIGKVSPLWYDRDTPKKNPNEGWIEKAVEAVAGWIAKDLNAALIVETEE